MADHPPQCQNDDQTDEADPPRTGTFLHVRTVGGTRWGIAHWHHLRPAPDQIDLQGRPEEVSGRL